MVVVYSSAPSPLVHPPLYNDSASDAAPSLSPSSLPSPQLSSPLLSAAHAPSPGPSFPSLHGSIARKRFALYLLYHSFFILRVLLPLALLLYVLLSHSVHRSCDGRLSAWMAVQSFLWTLSYLIDLLLARAMATPHSTSSPPS